MPEGPEVLDYYNFIEPLLRNKILNSFDILSGKYLKKDLVNLCVFKEKLPSKIKDIIVKGKTIFITLDNKHSLVITHGMSGYWSDDEEKHSRVKFSLSEVSELFYVDPRNFGTIIISLNEEELYFRQNKLGPYVLNDSLTFDTFYSRINKKPKSKIAVALLDQNLISGIGNYLRCDILWYAKINGDTRIGDLTTSQKTDLYNASINICRYYSYLSYELDFTPEDYERDFFIYMEEYDIYGNQVSTKTLNGRTFHFVEL
jgi:DNA-formamidopyrimidine glycosylase